jgi:hypothetical protein
MQEDKPVFSRSKFGEQEEDRSQRKGKLKALLV